ncbi:MAG: hypothetical protein AAGN35_19860 [Bacteroidota bacterium]
MRATLLIWLFSLGTAQWLIGQTDPMAFFDSDDPMEILRAYQTITGTPRQPGLAQRAVTSPGTDADGVLSKQIFASDTAWSYIEVQGYVHPGIVPLIAKTMGWKQDLIHDLARFERGFMWDEFIPIEHPEDALAGYSGPEILRRELGTTDPLVRLRALGLRNRDLVMTRIPVPPLKRRVKKTATSPQAVKRTNFLFRTLVYYSRLYEYADEPESRRQLDFFVQRYFEILLQARAGEPVDLVHSINFAPNSAVEWSEAPTTTSPDPLRHAVLYLNADLVLLRKGDSLSLFNLPNRMVVRRLPPVPGRLIGLNHAHTTALLLHYDGLVQVDLKRGQRLPKLLGDMNYITGDEAGEVGYLYDWRNGQGVRLWLVPDYPITEAYTTDQSHIFLLDKAGYGGIFSTATGFPALEIAEPVPAEDLPQYGGTGEIELGPGAAIAPHHGHWLIYRFNTFLVDNQPQFQIQWKVKAAAFNAAGDELLLIGTTQGCRLDLSEAQKSGDWSQVEEECWDF